MRMFEKSEQLSMPKITSTIEALEVIDAIDAIERCGCATYR